jgi:hypothetical protein
LILSLLICVDKAGQYVKIRHLKRTGGAKLAVVLLRTIEGAAAQVAADSTKIVIVKRPGEPTLICYNEADGDKVYEAITRAGGFTSRTEDGFYRGIYWSAVGSRIPIEDFL